MIDAKDISPMEIARNLRALMALPGLPLGAAQEMELAAEHLELTYNLLLAAVTDNLHLRGAIDEEPTCTH
jgi:hypothetical protein